MSNMEPDEGTQAEDQPAEGPRWDNPEGPRWDAAEETESDDANDPDDRADS
jgi:hypothetical protein